LKNKVGVTYCDCFQTFVARENFFEKDTDRLFAKISSRVSNICKEYEDMTKIEDSDKIKNDEVLAREFITTS